MSTKPPATDDTTEEPTTNIEEISSEVRDIVEEAADRLDAEDEPLTVARLAGTTLQLGIDNDAHRFTTIADACRYRGRNGGDTMSTADPALAGDRTPKEVVQSIVERAAQSLNREGKRITTDRLVGRAICLGKAGNYSESLYRTAAIDYIEDRVRDDREDLVAPAEGGVGR